MLLIYMQFWSQMVVLSIFGAALFGTTQKVITKSTLKMDQFKISQPFSIKVPLGVVERNQFWSVYFCSGNVREILSVCSQTSGKQAKNT